MLRSAASVSMRLCECVHVYALMYVCLGNPTLSLSVCVCGEDFVWLHFGEVAWGFCAVNSVSPWRFASVCVCKPACSFVLFANGIKHSAGIYGENKLA